MSADTDFSLIVDNDPSKESIDELLASLVAYNTEKAVPDNYRRLAVFIRSDGQLLGGASGETYFEWLFINYLWISEMLRGRGYGSRVLQAMENEAKERGCKAVWLDTFSFQAKPFYEMHGYQQFGELHDYPPGFDRYFLWKKLEGSCE